MLHAASLELRACLAAVLGAEDEVLAGYRLHARLLHKPLLSDPFWTIELWPKTSSHATVTKPY
jgi:hypothetical protein